MQSISNSVASLETCIGQDGLRVEFFRLADRYAHQIWLVKNLVRTELLLQSHEGLDVPDADCLPALQGLNIEQLPSGDQAAALIGMSGANHWSLTIEPHQRDGSPTMVFDAACRIRNGPPRLNSRYLVDGGLPILAESQQIAVQAAQGRRLELKACPIDGMPDAQLTVCDRQVDITQTIVTDDANGQTVRWRYAISLATSVG